MSVVNKMLNDLEQREAQSVQGHANYQAPLKKKSPAWLVILLLVALASAGAYLVYDWFFAAKQSPLQTTQVKAKQVQTASVPNSTAAPKPSASAELSPKSQSAPESKPEPKPATAVKTELAATLEQRSEPNPEPEPQTQTVDEVDVAELAQTANLRIIGSKTTKRPHYQVLVADALARNQHDEALSTLQQWITAEPQNITPMKKLAAVLFARGNSAQAKTVLSKARGFAPTDASVRLMQARLFVQGGDISAASEALELATDDLELLHYRAAFARENSLFEQALQDYTMLSRLDPSNIRGWLGLAVVSQQQRKVQLAIAAYKQVLQLDSGNNDIREFAQQQLIALKTKHGVAH